MEATSQEFTRPETTLDPARAPSGRSVALAIPVGQGWKVDVTALIPVEFFTEGSDIVATAKPFGISVTRPGRDARAALLGLQQYLEWAFLDLALAPKERLTPDDHELLAALACHLRLPRSPVKPLTAQEKEVFLSFPKHERRTILRRQARLSSLDESAVDGE